MLTKITHITLFVHNQEDALNFYTKLGFIIHTDTQFGESRWLTLHLSGQKDVELAVLKAETEQEKSLVGKQGLAKPFISLESNDCYKDYEALQNAGVNFLEKPSVEPWGISCAFKDLYGNMIYICQPS